eukprot:g2308.t1
MTQSLRGYLVAQFGAEQQRAYRVSLAAAAAVDVAAVTISNIRAAATASERRRLAGEDADIEFDVAIAVVSRGAAQMVEAAIKDTGFSRALATGFERELASASLSVPQSLSFSHSVPTVEVVVATDAGGNNAVAPAPAEEDAENAGMSAAATTATPGARRALTIGINAYDRSPLRNPRNDAKAIYQSLTRTGWQALNVLDPDSETMFKAIHSFIDSIEKGDGVFFFFAGHGEQYQNKNYMLATNLPGEDRDLPRKAPNMHDMLDQITAKEPRFTVVLLDCCRTFAGMTRSARSVTRGLVEMSSPCGTIIGYACAPGRTASDGTAAGGHGIYTKHILRNIERPGVPLLECMNEIAIGVEQETDGNQVPWMSMTALRDRRTSLCPGETEEEKLRRLLAERDAEMAKLNVVKHWVEGNGRLGVVDIFVDMMAFAWAIHPWLYAELNNDEVFDIDVDNEQIIAWAKEATQSACKIHLICPDITDSAIIVLAENCKGLEDIYLFQCNIADAGLRALAENCKGLTQISLYQCTNITDVGLRALAKNCKGLAYINLRGCTKITGGGFRALADGCKGLAYIGLNNTKITSAGLRALAENCKGLAEIDLCNCNKITDAGLRALAENCKGLEKIFLLKCNITNAGLRALAENCKGLAQISLYQCTNITYAGLWAFKAALPACSVSGLQ